VSALVTGAAGFIGSNLADKLSNKLCCDIDKPGMYDPASALKILEAGGVDVVYHLGAISSTTETSLSKISYHNIHFSSQLLDICIERNIPFIYASSASVYGLGKFGFSECTQMTPLNYYAISKASFDTFAKRKMLDHPNAKIVGLRYFNVYGHNEDHKEDMASPVHKFLEQSKTGNIKIFEGSENFKRDFVHVDDAVDITKDAKDFKSGIYNVGTGVSRTFLEVAEIISSLTNAKIEEIPFPDHLIGKYQDFTCSDNSEINNVYSLKRISLEEGIKKVYNVRHH
jgi:ADP-L-glycero-D-manno-heptose 6-epimerase